MPADQTRATLLAFVKAVGGTDPLEPYLAHDASFTALATGRVIQGRAAVADFIRTFHGKAFAVHTGIDMAVMGADDRLLVDLHIVGRHVGEFMGIPATGRWIGVHCRLACEARGDKVVAITGHLPIDQLLAQIRGDATEPGIANWHPTTALA